MIENLKEKINIEFFRQKTEIVAKKVLNKILVKKEDDYILTGKIVETEAYIPLIDKANHAYIGKTDRNRAMFDNGGILYIYSIYGIHHCINFVTEYENLGCAVLIRAIEPIEGIEKMKLRRKTDDIINLCNGPGKICQAFNFTKDFNNYSLNSDNIYLLNNSDLDEDKIIKTTRIGIKKSAELELRYYIKNNRFISKK